jgi:hypothetical protein
MIEKLTKEFIEKIIIEINKEDNKIKLETEIINPILINFTAKLYPYISLLFVMYSFNIILIITIIIILINNKNNLKISNV